MTIKIIEKNFKDGGIKRRECPRCGSILEYTSSDIIYRTYNEYQGCLPFYDPRIFEGAKTYTEFDCPSCSHPIQI